MKKIFNLVALVCLVAAVCVSCKPKSLGNAEQYVFFMSTQIDKTDSVAGETYLDDIAGAMSAIGVKEGYELPIEGTDSLDVFRQLKTKMDELDLTLKALPEYISGKLVVRGIKKEFLAAAENNDKSHPIRLVEKKLFGAPVNGVTEKGLHNGEKHSLLWVKSIHSQMAGETIDETHNVAFGMSTNYCADGKDVTLVLEHNGQSGDEKSQFAWNVEDKYITDVIAVYGMNDGEDLKVEGRMYVKMADVCDLNLGNSGEYIHLYATTAPVKGYEDFYLITGYAPKAEYTSTQCRMLTDKLFKAEDYLKDGGEIFAIDGVEEHKFVERVVKAYKIDGSYVDELDTNFGVEQPDYVVRMILTYASK